MPNKCHLETWEFGAICGKNSANMLIKTIFLFFGIEIYCCGYFFNIVEAMTNIEAFLAKELEMI